MARTPMEQQFRRKVLPALAAAVQARGAYDADPLKMAQSAIKGMRADVQKAEDAVQLMDTLWCEAVQLPHKMLVQLLENWAYRFEQADMHPDRPVDLAEFAKYVRQHIITPLLPCSGTGQSVLQHALCYDEHCIICRHAQHPAEVD